MNFSEITPHTRSNASGLVGWERVKGYLRVGTWDRQTDQNTEKEQQRERPGRLGPLRGMCHCAGWWGLPNLQYLLPTRMGNRGSKLKVTWNMVHGGVLFLCPSTGVALVCSCTMSVCTPDLQPPSPQWMAVILLPGTYSPSSGKGSGKSPLLFCSSSPQYPSYNGDSGWELRPTDIWCRWQWWDTECLLQRDLRSDLSHSWWSSQCLPPVSSEVCLQTSCWLNAFYKIEAICWETWLLSVN